MHCTLQISYNIIHQLYLDKDGGDMNENHRKLVVSFLFLRAEIVALIQGSHSYRGLRSDLKQVLTPKTVFSYLILTSITQQSLLLSKKFFLKM